VISWTFLRHDDKQVLQSLLVGEFNSDN